MILWLLQGQGMMIPFPFNRVHGMIKARSQGSSCWWSTSCPQPVCPWCVPMYKSNPNCPLGWRCREVREMGIRVSSMGYPRGLPASFPISCTNRRWFFEVLVYFFLLLRVRRIYISAFPEKGCIIKPIFKVPWIQNVHSLQAQKTCWEWINTLQIFFLTVPCPHIPPTIAPESSAVPHTP